MDHPSTQQFKKERIEEAEFEIPNNLHFIFRWISRKDFPMSSYRMKDLKIKRRTFSLLGVTYYLTKRELSSLIECLFAMVPEGSSIVFDYPDENLFTERDCPIEWKIW